METDLSITSAIKLLEDSNNYRVIKRFKKNAHYNLPNTKKKQIGLFVDVETTGSSISKDKIIELALVPFEYDSDGKIYRVLESYVGFQDPGVPIPKIIVDLTGITDEMVTGQSFDNDKINEIAKSASIIIAHHASFDKKFITDLLPVFKKKLWACTVAHIDWRAEDISSAKLEYIAYKFGVFYSAHRAEIDSLIGIHVLAQTLPVSKQPALKSLIENATSKRYKIWAENSPYESKDTLKDRGYKWNGSKNDLPRSWYKIVKENSKDAELDFLYTKIYGKIINLKVELVDPRDLF